MGICSIIIKREELEESVLKLAEKYKPAKKSSYNTISHDLLDRISDVDRVLEVNEALRADLLNYICDSTTALEAYIKKIEENEEFRKYEMSEPLGIFSENASPLGCLSKNETIELQKEPVKYVSKATEYIGKAA